MKETKHLCFTLRLPYQQGLQITKWLEKEGLKREPWIVQTVLKEARRKKIIVIPKKNL